MTHFSKAIAEYQLAMADVTEKMVQFTQAIADNAERDRLRRDELARFRTAMVAEREQPQPGSLWAQALERARE